MFPRELAQPTRTDCRICHLPDADQRQPRQDEITEIDLADGGTSAFMPPKNNPIGTIILVALARFKAVQISAMHHAMIQEQRSVPGRVDFGMDGATANLRCNRRSPFHRRGAFLADSPFGPDLGVVIVHSVRPAY